MLYNRAGIYTMQIKRLFTDKIEVSKDLNKDVKDEPIKLSFIASTAGADRYGDIIEQSGWQLDSYRKNPVILFNHNPQEMPIGKGAVEVVDNALMIDIEFDMDDERAAKIARKAQKGYLNAVSVGFNPIESTPRADLPDGHFAKGVSGNYFSKAELLEVSIVTIPANSEAVAAKEYQALINKQDAISLSPEQIEKLKEFIPQLYGASSMHAKQAEYLEGLLGVEPQSRYYHDDDSEEDSEEEKETKDVDYGLKSNAKEAMEALKESTQQALKNKAEQHNEEYGDDPEKKLTNRNYLAVSYHRGLAAYYNNPESVRPNMQANQWAMARVNGLLFAMSTGKFKSKPYDMDLLPNEHPLKKEDKQLKQDENTNFPAMGDNEAVSLRNSKYKLFPADYAANIKESYPAIWSKGGNILGNQQYTLLSRILKNNGTPETENQEEAVRLREAWAARHEKDFRLAGVVAQMKWYVIGSRGLDHMKQVIETEIEKIDKTFGDLPKTKEVNGELEALFAVLKDIIKE